MPLSPEPPASNVILHFTVLDGALSYSGYEATFLDMPYEVQNAFCPDVQYPNFFRDFVKCEEGA